ncbi:MAG: squalene/phytoene synthase family protein, partial [Acidobacteriota bacterium]
NILRDIGEDARRGRIYIPKEDLTKFGLTEDEILSCRMSEAMTEMIKFQIARARDYYRTGEQGIPLLEKDARFTVLLASRVYGAILSEIEKQNFDVFARRAHTTKLQKLLSMPRIYLEAARM